ncbi:zf-HC2 domain-containing protein [Streptomyces milbemycinicus]|uniref:zf-HC2 domain-containing protein n=1 Tax=Streptomyces milbemycinicus TaxID=476552 RepID=UPI0033E5BF79
MTEGPASLDADTYIRLHQDHHPQLVGYARTLIGTPWPAEDAVAEAYFLVWRRLRSGEAVGDVPAALKATVRDLAMSAARRDRAQRVSYVDLLARVIEDLPQRWVKALWQAEAEQQPPVAEVGRRAAAGTSPAAALERARDGMRQHFLRAQPGGPADPACGWCWERLPEHVRGADSPTQAEQVAIHVAGCADCRTRVEQLMAADARLSALVGPALMVLLSRRTADYLVPLARAGGAVAALSSSPSGGAVAALSSLPSGAAHEGPAADTVKLPARTSEDRPPRHRARRRAGRAGRPVAVIAGAGALALAGAAVAAGLVLTGGDSSGPEQGTAASQPSSESSPGATSSPWGQESARSDATGHGAPGDASSGRSTKGAASGAAADQSPGRSPSSSTAPSSASSAPGTSGALKSTSASETPSTAKTPTRAPATRQPTPTRTQSATPKPTRSQDQTATATPEPTTSTTEPPAAEPSKSTKPTEPAKPTKATDEPPAPGRSGGDGWDNG